MRHGICQAKVSINRTAGVLTVRGTVPLSVPPEL